VQSIKQGEGTAKQVVLDNGQTLDADIVVLATGIQANTDLLQGSSIETDQGILVNDRMQTNFSHVYAGGDFGEGETVGSEFEHGALGDVDDALPGLLGACGGEADLLDLFDRWTPPTTPTVWLDPSQT
jgi:NADPH-dependent 2,4-dienoyl-CoA reductase/sulfur reductase-like enzyme